MIRQPATLGLLWPTLDQPALGAGGEGILHPRCQAHHSVTIGQVKLEPQHHGLQAASSSWTVVLPPSQSLPGLRVGLPSSGVGLIAWDDPPTRRCRSSCRQLVQQRAEFGSMLRHVRLFGHGEQADRRLVIRACG